MVEQLDDTTQAALMLALEELSRWPDLPGIPYWVHQDGETKRLQIPPDHVKGILDAMLRHVKELYPTAVKMQQKADNWDRLKRMLKDD